MAMTEVFGGEQLREFGRLFQQFMQVAVEQSGGESELLVRLRAHLGVDPVGLPVVAETYPTFDHANVQIALEAYVASEGRSVELVGLGGHGMREHHSLSEMVQSASEHRAFGLGGVDYSSAPVGIDAVRPVVNFGIFLIADGDVRMAALLRGSSERWGRPSVRLEVLCADEHEAQHMLAEIRDLIVRHNVFRGQVVSFANDEFGHHEGVGPLRFHRRPSVGADDIVLPPGTLASIERLVVGVARHRDALREGGFPLKRGALLFGPPGTGKTHTVRYLISQLTDFTVVELPGMALRYIQHACALARMLQPALLVLEDVDLIAESRSMRPGMDNPLLYQVLNEMDGLASEADVAFLLTTNRADLLEEAIAQRPGRVDLAVELPLPDAEARRRLFTLYGRGLDVASSDVDAIVTATEGATGSFFAELARRATLHAVTEGAGRPGPAHVRAALTELQASRDVVVRAQTDREFSPRFPPTWAHGPAPGIAPR
jgi:cell division protease FtsH